MVCINNGEHDNPDELPKENSEGSLNTDNAVYSHTNLLTKLLEEMENLEYIYQHFQIGTEKSIFIVWNIPNKSAYGTLFSERKFIVKRYMR